MAIETSIPAEFQPLVDELMDRHAPSGKISIVKDLVGGRSPAAVFLVDIDAASTKPSAEQSTALSGQFVLKLERQRVWDQPEPDESARHRAAWDRNVGFSDKHIPRLLGHAERNHSHALLYQIAGHSLVSLVTADSLDAGALKHFGSEVIRALLSDWNSDYTQTALSARQILEQWLDYRLQPELAPELHKFLLEEAGDKKEYVSAERVFANPRWLCNASFLNEANQTRFIGKLHGDLHPGNLLLERNVPRSDRFWLIDFALSRDGPLGYDGSYLELALLLHYLQGAGSERMFGILEALEAAEDDPKSSMIPVQDLGLLQCLRVMRQAADKWQKEAQPNRYDPYLAQQLLSRVAVSLNWCNKPLEPSARRLALAYGAWASWRYVRTFHESEWRRTSSVSAEARVGEADTDDSGELSEPPKQWTDFWGRVGKFDAALAKFVLVTDRLEGCPDSASLGMLPWSVVIDLDGESDNGGLYSGMATVLEKTDHFRNTAAKQFR